MKTLLTLAALAAVSVSTPVWAEDPAMKSESSVKTLSNGGVQAEDKTENTETNGTVTKTDATKKINIDSKGNKETKVNIETSKDPKGLFNKSTTKIENKAVEKDGNTEYSHKKTIDGKTVEESDDTQKQ